MGLNLFEVTTILKNNGINEAAKQLKVKKVEIYNFLKENGLSYVNNEVKPAMDITKIIKKDSGSNNKPQQTVIQKDNKDIDIESLKELISLIEPIRSVILEYNNRRNIIEIEKYELNPPNITEIKQKLFKIDVDVLKDWDEFVAAHKQYKVQSLISLALAEFIQKYK